VSGIVCYREYSESEIPEDAVLAAEFEDFRRMYALCLTKTDKADSVDKADRVDKVEADKASTGGEPGQAVIPEMDHNNNVIANENQKITKRLANQQPLDQEESAIASPVPENVAEAVESTSEDWQNDESHSEKNKLQENKLQENKLAENWIKKNHSDEIAIQENSSEKILLASKKDEKNRVLFSPGKNDYLTPKLQVVQAKMGNLGYYYPAELIKSYYLSLKSKPFVIIKGRIGSGKTSFPRLFAEAIGASQENGRFKRLLVGKNWEDHSHLFGRLDSRGHFIAGPIMTCLKTAKESPDKPHFFILDEMDQSPTADYLRLLLEGINGNKEPFLTREDFGADITAFREYGNLSFPDNLYLIATINQGAGSFPVDSRVIDSGNVIEMPVVEIGIFSDYGSPAEASDWENNAFKIDSQARGLPEILERLINLLNKLQQLLIKHGCPIGYRGKNEILAFGINSGAEGLYSEVEVIDLAILQRVIPALAGDQKTTIPVYQSLAVFLLAGDAQESLMQLPLNRFISQYEALLKAAAIPCPRSGQEILKRLKQKK
jgi:energy-coupling factor transporter ATP-binding protein EcfA2